LTGNYDIVTMATSYDRRLPTLAAWRCIYIFIFTKRMVVIPRIEQTNKQTARHKQIET